MTGDSVIRGRASGDGRLVAADPPLLALQVEAGGVEGGPLIVPTLAHLARLAMRLGVAIARPATVASGASDISLWVRMKPDVDGVDIAIIEWEELPRAPEPVDLAAMGAHGELARDGWIWHVDARLRFHLADAMAPEAAPGHDLPRAGDVLTAYFRLQEAQGGEERLPLLAAVAARRPFHRQPALLRSDETIRYSLAALPTFDALGRLTGYRGKAIREGAATAGASASEQTGGYSPLFNRRLDSALRQPLSRIIANANTISGQLEGPLRADYAGYAADIAEAGRHLIELVDDLADLQAIERPDFAVVREEVDVADLGRRAAGLLKMRAAERQIAIEPPDSDERMLAAAEYRRVLQILVNLIGNAVRYSPDHSQIWVRVDEDNAAGTVSVIVADQGRGIDPADHERIFERFERVNPEDNTGSGLGLYISRRLARAMGGEIAVESARGQGARFTLTLPAWTADRR